MSKVFVIPDIHLKPWVFAKSENTLYKHISLANVVG